MVVPVSMWRWDSPGEDSGDGHTRECAQCHGAVHVDVVKMANFMFCVFYHNKKDRSINFGLQGPPQSISKLAQGHGKVKCEE